MMKNCNPHLFLNGDPEKLIAPMIGMNVGHLDYEESGISYWIKSFCFQNHKACVYGKNSKQNRKEFVCSDSECCWKIAISRGTATKMNW